MVPFWHWGIYRLDLAVPESLSNLLYEVWLEKDFIRAMLVVFIVCVIVLSSFIRRTSFGELGIRLDNLWRSGKECLVVLCILLIIPAVVVLAFPDSFSFERYFRSKLFFDDVAFGALSGTGQQFLLQGVFLLRTLQIFKRPSAAILASSTLFSLLHTPNIKLMALTLIFGFICSSLFIRNRNIFTLGIMHGVVQQTVRMLFASLVVSGTTYYGLGYYDYNLRVGPHRGDPDFLATMEYNGGTREIGASSSPVSIPVSIVNRSISRWDSEDKHVAVFASYHLLDAQGMMVSYDNVLTPFEEPVEPGESVTVDLMVSAPPRRGEYLVEVDIVKRQVAAPGKISWFKYRGSKTVRIPLSAR